MRKRLDPLPLEHRPQPDPYHGRTGQQLQPENKVYQQILKTDEYAAENKMKLNLNKTKLMLFNPCKMRDFMPECHVGQAHIDLVEETKLLGVVIRSDLSWASNTESLQKELTANFGV